MEKDMPHLLPYLAEPKSAPQPAAKYHVGDRVLLNGRVGTVLEIGEGGVCKIQLDAGVCSWGIPDAFEALGSLADEPSPVDDAATYSEFAEADECDDVNHPTHYTSHPSGVECITITEAFNFNVGNAIKYLWRAGLKGDSLEDLRKAAWYVQREIERAKR